MLQLDNGSPFVVSLAAIPDTDGVDTLQVIAKGTFRIADTVLQLADVQTPIALHDAHHGAAETSSLREAGSVHPAKLGTDVVLLGHAHTPELRPAESSAVSVRVAERRKIVAVHGHRRWRARGSISRPEPFVRMPLTWEHAFGGPVHDARDRDTSDANPVGVGLRTEVDAPLPNLEDPARPIQTRGDRPRPVGFGPIAPSWSPRRRHAGTYDATWVRARAPRLPLDFDARFFHVAAPELAFDRHLRGDEAVEIIGASERGVLSFALPGVRPIARARLSSSWDERVPLRLETVDLRPDDGHVMLTWRAIVARDRSLLRVERVRLEGGAA